MYCCLQDHSIIYTCSCSSYTSQRHTDSIYYGHLRVGLPCLPTRTLIHVTRQVFMSDIHAVDARIEPQVSVSVLLGDYLSLLFLQQQGDIDVGISIAQPSSLSLTSQLTKNLQRKRTLDFINRLHLALHERSNQCRLQMRQKAITPLYRYG